MFPSSNVIFLVSLAIISWVMLCVMNPGQVDPSSHYMRSAVRSTDAVRLWVKRLLSITFEKSPILTIYLMCTLLAVLILINVIAKKVKTITVIAARTEACSNLLMQISHLKAENTALRNSLNHQKLENKAYMDYISMNNGLIRKLKTELFFVKERYERFKGKMTGTSSLFMEKKRKLKQNNFARDKYPEDDQTLTVNNKNLVNKILKQNYEKDNFVLFSNDCPNRDSSRNYLSYEDEVSSTPSSKDMSNINIVSTDQLQKIKRLQSGFFPQLTQLH